MPPAPIIGTQPTGSPVLGSYPSSPTSKSSSPKMSKLSVHTDGTTVGAEEVMEDERRLEAKDADEPEVDAEEVIEDES